MKRQNIPKMLEEYCWEDDFSSVTFYHGTSDSLSISKLLPAVETGVLREGWRKELTNKVFFTDSLFAAMKYARKACERFGGRPLIYMVKPEGDIWHIHTREFVADSAKIICAVDTEA